MMRSYAGQLLRRLATAATTCLSAALLAWLPQAATAQTTPPAWEVALAGNNNQPNATGASQATATAVNAAGDVFVTGSFSGKVAFGPTRLVSAFGDDIFVAKWDATAGAWAWAIRDGGPSSEIAYGIAVNGANVYVTGSFGTGSGASFSGQTLPGVGTNTADVFVAKYVDNGTSAANGWATSGGGTGNDYGYGIAVSGTNVYVTGSFFSNTNASFAGQALPGQGGQEAFVAKYVDQGASVADGWAVSNGGSGSDVGRGIAASGTIVYATGAFASGTSARIGGRALPGAGGQDAFVVKYTDAGLSATNGWAVSSGGNGDDQGNGLAVVGTNVYAVGSTSGSNIRIAGQPLTSAGGSDVFVAKYVDAGSSATNGWAVRGGGTGNDLGQGIAASGTSVYATGTFISGTGASFAGQTLVGTSASTTADAFVAKYVDSGTSVANGWAAGGGGTDFDQGKGLAVSGAGVYMAGQVGPTLARFGPATGPLLAPANSALLGGLDPATGTWQRADGPLQGTGTSSTAATAVNAAGDVFVAGYFTGTVGFGSTRLVSAGSTDVFVAKWDATAGAWAWATSGGGTDGDVGSGIAVSGASVYVTGYFGSSSNAIVAGQALFGMGTNSADVFVAKYVDNGTSVANGWATSGGGTDYDIGYGIAVSGTNVYVTGFFTSNTRASIAGRTLTGAGSHDVFVAKYVDQGSSVVGNWAISGGGSSFDRGQGIAVSGTNVYVTGFFSSNGNAYLGGQTLPGTGADQNFDVFVAKYVDNGGSVAYGWVTSGGGTGDDSGEAVAVSGSNVYVTGSFGSGTAATLAGQPLLGTGTLNADIFVAKYVDNGSSAANGWAVGGGGTGYDRGNDIAASGANVYVTGSFVSNTGASLAGQALPGAGNADVFVAKYVDQGTSAAPGWVASGGGAAGDGGASLALSGQRVYVGGSAAGPVTFGALTIGNPDNGQLNFLARLTDSNSNAPLPVALTQFAAAAEGPAAVRLTWATASEKNSQHFEVERSADGVAFAAIGTVAAAGTTATARTYTLRDAALPAGASVLYYRLRQVDLDGTAHYSPVRSVAVASGLSLYPNPALGGVATLSGVAPGVAVQVLDALGRVAATATADAAGTAHVAAGLVPGVYVVRAGSAALRLVVE
jgi:hypothetical protein